MCVVNMSNELKLAENIRIKKLDEENYLILQPDVPNILVGNHLLVELLKEFSKPANPHVIAKKISSQVKAEQASLLAQIEAIKRGGFLIQRGEKIETRLTREKPGGIVKMYLTLSERCNLECKHCFRSADSTKERNQLGIETLQQLIEEFAQLGGEDLIITGGEPFLEKEKLFVVLEASARHSIDTYVLTNGTLIGSRDIDQLAKLKNVTLIISVDGAKEETHDFIRGKGSFARITNTIRQLVDADIDVILNFTIMKTNYHEIEEFIGLATQLGVKVLEFQPLIMQGRAIKNKKALDLTNSELLQAYSTLRRLSKQIPRPIIVLYGEPLALVQLSDLTKRGCRLQDGTVAVDGKGDIYPCQGFMYPEMRLGNLNLGSLEQQWSSSQVMDQLYQLNILDFKECSGCELKYICNSGCIAEGYAQTRDLTSKNPLCGFLKGFYWDLIKEGAMKLLDET